MRATYIVRIDLSNFFFSNFSRRKSVHGEGDHVGVEQDRPEDWDHERDCEWHESYQNVRLGARLCKQAIKSAKVSHNFAHLALLGGHGSMKGGLGEN